MVRRTTVLIPSSELADLFSALSLWDKIQQGVLTTVTYARTTAPAKTFPGGTSRMLGHYNTAGAHACTTHQIIDQSGEILHWDEADVKVGEITIAKAHAR